MIETDNTDNKFEVSLRILGNELFALKLQSNNKTNKWMAASVLSLGLLILVISVFGGDIIHFFQGATEVISSK